MGKTTILCLGLKFFKGCRIENLVGFFFVFAFYFLSVFECSYRTFVNFFMHVILQLFFFFNICVNGVGAQTKSAMNSSNENPLCSLWYTIKVQLLEI
jgi:hypothetical protein